MFKRCFATVLFLTLFTWLPAIAAEGAGLEQRFVYQSPARDVFNLRFEDEKGKAYKLSDFKGRYVLLNVWATWCKPCVKEMPSLDALQKQLDPKKIALIALAQDRNGTVVIPAFYKRHELHNLKTYVDPEGMGLTQLGVRGVPTTLLINPEGKEIGRIENEVDWVHPRTLTFLTEKISAGQPTH